MVINIRPTYSPITPSITNCTPEKVSKAAISDPQPKAGPRSFNHQKKTTPIAANPASAMTSPNTVAKRSGMTEKLTKVLVQSRKSFLTV